MDITDEFVWNVWNVVHIGDYSACLLYVCRFQAKTYQKVYGWYDTQAKKTRLAKTYVMSNCATFNWQSHSIDCKVAMFYLVIHMHRYPRVGN